MNTRAHITKRLAGITALVLVFTLAIASAAMAQGSAERTYGGDNTQSFVASAGGSGGSGPSADVADSGSLPFTGLDLGLAAGGALLLIGAGAAMAAAASRKPTAE